MINANPMKIIVQPRCKMMFCDGLNCQNGCDKDNFWLFFHNFNVIL